MSLISSHQYLPKALGAVMALALGAPLLLASAPAQAQYYSNASTWTTVRGTTDIKTGPSYAYPSVGFVRNGQGVRLHGCLSDYSWCDVSFSTRIVNYGIRGYYPQTITERGWIEADHLSVWRGNQAYDFYSARNWYQYPVITFMFDQYWRNHYSQRHWYRDRDRFRHHRWDNDNNRDNRRWDRRDRDNRRDWDRDRRDWNVDRDRRDWDRNRNDRRDWDRRNDIPRQNPPNDRTRLRDPNELRERINNNRAERPAVLRHSQPTNRADMVREQQRLQENRLQQERQQRELRQVRPTPPTIMRPQTQGETRVAPQTRPTPAQTPTPQTRPRLQRERDNRTREREQIE